MVFDGFDGPIDDSNFGGRRIKDYLRQEYRNQDDELVATFICSRMRFERGEMQKRRERREIELPHPWTDDELAAIEEQVLAEKPRGRHAALLGGRAGGRRDRRHHQGPAGADRLHRLHRGRGGADPAHCGASVCAQALPQASEVGVPRPDRTHALEPVYSVHYNDYAAQLQGAQIAYDVGIQRTCWQIHSLTNWMGDAGKLKSLTGQYRAHVYLSDVVRLGGRWKPRRSTPTATTSCS